MQVDKVSARPVRGKRLFVEMIGTPHTPKFEMVSSLPDELLCVCTSFLDATSLTRMRQVNKRFRVLASHNEAGWSHLCQVLWHDKIHVGEEARRHPVAMIAYRLSLIDSWKRQEVTEQELCYDPILKTGTIWSFRFKESAGPDWTSWDPWWNGHEARRMVFLKDGTVKQYVEPETMEEEATLASPTFDAGFLVDPPVAMTWRYLSHVMDFPSRPRGAYIRFSVGGRDVPTYVVSRYPSNWGFLMESCWGLYTSFRLPPRRLPPPRMRLRRTQDGGRWLDVNGMESDTEDETTESTNKQNSLVDDSVLRITNEVQWKEALLYNFGARVLPEGEGAADEFDRTWGQTLDMERR